MALFTIADPHLSHGVTKPMDVFGGRWQGYVEKLEKNWRALIGPEDTVVLGGDISWGIDLKEAREDFLYLNRLPGRKIILKGNHDLWWTTIKKMNAFLQENQIENMFFLHNNCYFYQDIALCGTRGWFFEEQFQESHDEKIFKRELLRLEASLKAASAQPCTELYCFLHYPPIFTNFRCDEIIALLHKYQVTHCIYGHLHSGSLRYAIEGVQEGINFRLVSGDHVDFIPVLLKK